MCFFPVSTTPGTSLNKKMSHFECGHCPECLSRRANAWALRAVYEAKMHQDNCMITLTYDDYMRDSFGRVIGELPVNSDLHVDVRDVQLFLKRLRKRLGVKFKYILVAEYGKRTHRAHYHAVLFGVKFPDLIFYKKSKRGNVIYRSKILTETWNKGICTVDSINVTASVAKYCTKYCAKDTRCDDTFMLFSHHLGLPLLLEEFNGRYYVVEGRRYPIPRIVWQHVISSRYSVSARYVNRPDPMAEPFYSSHESFYRTAFLRYERNIKNRSLFRYARDNDSQYKRYLRYWKLNAKRLEAIRPSAIERVRLLDDSKYFSFKNAAYKYFSRRWDSVIPRSSRKSVYKFNLERPNYLPLPSCPATANDTNSRQKRIILGLKLYADRPKWLKILPRVKIFDEKTEKIPNFALQMNVFDL